MQIRSPQKNEHAFSSGGRKYHGPEDGCSQPAKKLLKAASNSVLGLAYKVDIQGATNLPVSGQHVYAPNHPGYLDPLVLSKVAGVKDVRFMAAIENFASPLGAKVNQWAGAFPVDRKNPHPQTMKHGEDLFSEGASLGIFPEGKPPENIGTLGPIKPGAALFALKGGADTVVPMAFHYKEGEATSSASKKKSLSKALLRAGAASVAATLGGALGLVASSIATGALAGTSLGAKAARKLIKNPNVRTPFPKLIGGAVGGLVGGGLGVAGMLALAAASPILLSTSAIALAAGGGSYLWDQWSQTRDVVEVSIAPPLKVEEFAQGADQRKAVTKLTEALHLSIGGELEKLSGIPYDASVEKIR